MAKIPTPDRGQPLDVSYIYALAEAVNSISEQAASVYKYTAIDSTAGTQSVLTTDAKFVAGEASVYPTATSVTAGSIYKWTHTFRGQFKYAPIVTASPVLIEGTTSGQNVSVVIEKVTNAAVSGIVRFNADGNLAIKVNIIAIGIPNS